MKDRWIYADWFNIGLALILAAASGFFGYHLGLQHGAGKAFVVTDQETRRFEADDTDTVNTAQHVAISNLVLLSAREMDLRFRTLEAKVDTVKTRLDRAPETYKIECSSAGPVAVP